MLRGFDRGHEGTLNDSIELDGEAPRELFLHIPGNKDHPITYVAPGRILHRILALKLPLVQ